MCNYYPIPTLTTVPKAGTGVDPVGCLDHYLFSQLRTQLESFHLKEAERRGLNIITLTFKSMPFMFRHSGFFK